jgi:hypothetical protein
MSFQHTGSPPAAATPRMQNGGVTEQGLAYRGRESAMDDDDDDALDVGAPPVAVHADGVLHVQGDDGQTLAYRQGAISLDQVRRLAMQSAYRGGLAAD